MKRELRLAQLAELKADIDRGLADVAEGRLAKFDAKSIIARGRKLLADRLTSSRAADSRWGAGRRMTHERSGAPSFACFWRRVGYYRAQRAACLAPPALPAPVCRGSVVDRGPAVSLSCSSLAGI